MVGADSLVQRRKSPGPQAGGEIALDPRQQGRPVVDQCAVKLDQRSPGTDLRQGIGTAVTEKLFEIARARGCQGIWLGTEVDNAPALALYRKLGGDEMTGVYFGWDGAFDAE